jgi:hypothetical protein
MNTTDQHLSTQVSGEADDVSVLAAVDEATG